MKLALLAVMILLPQKLWYDCPFYLQLGKAKHNDAKHLITHNLPKAIITEKTSSRSDEVFSGGPSRCSFTSPRRRRKIVCRSCAHAERRIQSDANGNRIAIFRWFSPCSIAHQNKNHPKGGVVSCFGGPSRARTLDQPVMSRWLWPTELMARIPYYYSGKRYACQEGFW